jgi:Tol biopolymer transport system component
MAMRIRQAVSAGSTCSTGDAIGTVASGRAVGRSATRSAAAANATGAAGLSDGTGTAVATGATGATGATRSAVAGDAAAIAAGATGAAIGTNTSWTAGHPGTARRTGAAVTTRSAVTDRAAIAAGAARAAAIAGGAGRIARAAGAAIPARGHRSAGRAARSRGSSSSCARTGCSARAATAGAPGIAASAAGAALWVGGRSGGTLPTIRRSPRSPASPTRTTAAVAGARAAGAASTARTALTAVAAVLSAAGAVAVEVLSSDSGVAVSACTAGAAGAAGAALAAGTGCRGDDAAIATGAAIAAGTTVLPIAILDSADPGAAWIPVTAVSTSTAESLVTEMASVPASSRSPSSTLPTRVYWNSRGALDPADTNDSFDLYGWDIGNNNFDASIHLMTGGTATGGVFGVAATNDGAVTVFESASPNLPGSNGLVEQAYIRRSNTDINIGQQPFGGPTRTSAAGFSFISPLHATSDDGGLAAFVSDAPAFGSPILSEGPAEQVLVRDVASGKTRLVSAAPDGTAGNGDSDQPSVDASGDRVAFESSATNLVSGDTNDAEDVFVRNLSSGATTLVDRTDGGGVPLDGAFQPEISADGTKVVFVSDSADIPGAPPDSKDHVYEVDLGTGDVTLIDRASGGAPANDGSGEPDVDGDGRRVAFVSESSNLGGGTDESVYVRDLTNPASPTTTWVSTPQDANPAHDRGISPSIDRNGERIAFAEENANFGFGITGGEQVFVRDLGAHSTTLASAGPSGPASTNAGEPSLSADGSRVAFTSNAPELPGALPNRPDVFVRDLRAGRTLLGSVRDGGGGAGRFGAGGGGDSGSLSGNGACVAFDSNSDDLVSGGYGSDFQHSFLHALSAACPAAGTHPDKTAPVISHFSVTHRRFADGSKRTAVSAAKRGKPRSIPRGTTFKFKLSEAASVRIAITEKVKGHRARKHAPCRAARRGQRRDCTRSVTLVTLVRAHVTAGAKGVAFTGRFGSKHLGPGSYTATITATDLAGNRSRSHSLRFTVVRP